MNCENCNRDNVIKAYCYFSRRQEAFLQMYGKAFTLENFASFAVKMELKWHTRVHCNLLTQETVKSYWDLLKPYLVSVLHEETSKINYSPSCDLGTPNR
jgi:hypothetical protein